MNFTEILLRNGFEIPSSGYTKDDPRGEEYGFYSVDPVLQPNGILGVHLTKLDERAEDQWNCFFSSVAMFEAWIKDTL